MVSLYLIQSGYCTFWPILSNAHSLHGNCFVRLLSRRWGRILHWFWLSRYCFSMHWRENRSISVLQRCIFPHWPEHFARSYNWCTGWHKVLSASGFSPGQICNCFGHHKVQQSIPEDHEIYTDLPEMEYQKQTRQSSFFRPRWWWLSGDWGLLLSFSHPSVSSSVYFLTEVFKIIFSKTS